MATLSPQLLSRLGNPTGMLQGARILGQALGSAPGILAEKQREKEKLARTSAVSQLLTKGIEYANAGKQEEYNSVVADLQNKVNTATDPEEQKTAQQALSALNQQRRVLETNVERGQTRDGVRLLTSLEEGSGDVSELQKQFNALPVSAQDNARASINNRNRHEQNKKRLEREKFIDDNQASISAAIKDGDLDALDAIVTKAASVGAGTEVRILINSRREYHEKNKQYAEDLELNKVGPRTESLEQQFNDLLNTYPESARKDVKDALDEGLKAYKTFAENNWNEAQGVWNTGARERAKRLEEKISDRMSGLHYKNVTERLNRVTTIIDGAEQNIGKLNRDIALVNSSDPKILRDAAAFLRMAYKTEALNKHRRDGTYEALLNERADILVNMEINKLLVDRQESQAQLFEAHRELEDTGPKDDTPRKYTFGEAVQEEIDDAMAENEDRSETDIVVQFIRTGQVAVDGDNVITFTGKGKSVTEQLGGPVEEVGTKGFTMTGYGSSIEDYLEDQRRKYPSNKNVSTTGY